MDSSVQFNIPNDCNVMKFKYMSKLRNAKPLAPKVQSTLARALARYLQVRNMYVATEVVKRFVCLY